MSGIFFYYKFMIRILLFIFFLALPIVSVAQSTLKIMSYNIRGGVGMDGIRDFNRSAVVINTIAPDIVALQEIDSVTARNGRVNTMEILGALTGMYPVFAPAIPYDGGAYGIGLLSKQKPIAVSRYLLPGREEGRALIVAEFDDYIFYATHFSLTKDDQLASLKIVDSLASSAAKPIFFAGDLNFTPKDEQHKLFTDLFTPLSADAPTYPADKPNEHIDYIATGKVGAFYAKKVCAYVVNAPTQSDHRPTVAVVQYGNILRTDPYLQNPTEGGVTVCWQTFPDAYSYVQYGVDTTATATTTARTLIEGQAAVGTNNKVRLTGIEAGKTYYYRIVSRHITSYGAYSKSFGGEYISNWYKFQIPDGDFTAIVFNDLHQRRQTMDALMKVVKDQGIKYDFVIFNGDCVDDPENLSQALSSLSYFNRSINGSSIPSIYIRGNHEIRGAFSVGFHSIVDYPGGEHSYGAFNIGSTRFVVLDCGEDKPDSHPVYYGLNDFADYRASQADFLKAELGSKQFKKATHRVLLNHIPLYNQPEEWANLASDYWCNILVDAPFDMSINGHTHRADKIEKNKAGNNFPILVGGGYNIADATLIVVKNRARKISAQCLNCDGEIIFKID